MTPGIKSVLNVITRPLPRDGGMAPQKPGNSSEIVERQRVRSWTVQNEMRSVLGRVSTGAAGRIFNSANPKNRNLIEDCVRCSVDERGHSEHNEGAQVPQWKLREPVCQKI